VVIAAGAGRRAPLLHLTLRVRLLDAARCSRAAARRAVLAAFWHDGIVLLRWW